MLISVPDGERLAKKTLTTPRNCWRNIYSWYGGYCGANELNQAIVDTIRVELRQRRVSGKEYAARPRKLRFQYILKNIGLNPKNAVLTSNFIGETLDICKELGFRGALLVGHIGKLVKIAGGMLNTHSKFGDCRMEILASHAGASGLNSERIAEMLECVTCDDALHLLDEAGVRDKTFERLTDRISFIMNHRAAGELETGAILFSKKDGFLCETRNARSLLRNIMEE